MASMYTHFRFGNEIINLLDEDLKKLAENYPDLFCIGQQGPDIFFFHPKTLMKDDSPGTIIHNLSGKDFIDKQKEILVSSGKNSNQAGYMLGVLCHYTLDSIIHPLVNEVCEVGEFNHITVETELDRYYLEKDGFNPVEVKLNKFLPNTKLVRSTVSEFYEGYENAQKSITKNTVRFFRAVKRIFYAPISPKEKALIKILEKSGNMPKFNGLIMRLKPYKQAEKTNPVLAEKYELAIKEAPRLLRNAFDYIYNNGELDSHFELNFEGVINEK